MDSSIRVRFAPSPTGALHVGGARTALFNFLFARRQGGRFLLRIEDTDIRRSKSHLADQILRSLQWLGLQWDEAIVYQSERREAHVHLCHDLLSRGAAYRCFCSVEALKARRQAAQAREGGYRYDRTCLLLSPEEILDRLAKGLPYVLRFRIPEGETVFEDLIHGHTVFRHEELDDFVLLRSDGTPVYQVAVVSDDHAMGITHVIRGDDHLSNTPKQILIYQAMRWPVPQFGHLPMIWGPDKKRLSKRHGAVSIEAYREAGYLPEAVVNFLALLGWAPDDNTEIFTLDTLIPRFSLDRVSKKPAIFDEKKLEWMNGQHIRLKPPEALLEPVVDHLRKADLIGPDDPSPSSRKKLLHFITLMRERVKRLGDFATSGAYFFKDPEAYEEEAVEKHWSNPETRDRMQRFLETLEMLASWEEAQIEMTIRALAHSLGIPAGKLIHPARLALTGGSASPGLFETMAFLGKETVLRRIRKALLWIKNR